MLQQDVKTLLIHAHVRVQVLSVGHPVISCSRSPGPQTSQNPSRSCVWYQTESS
jgi:hypothetical protein